MKLIDNLSEKEYEKYCNEHIKESHFLHSYVWGKFQQKERNVIAHYVGLKDDNNRLCATALLLEKNLVMGYKYFYCPRGYLIDYKNNELLDIFTTELKKYAKNKKAIFIKIDPDLKLHDLDIEGNIVEDGIDNMDVVNELKKLGYKHLGFNKNFENNQPRYTFRLNLNKSIDEITKNFHPTTRKIINRGNPYDLILIKNDINTFDDFYKTMQETSQRENIVNHPYEYYKEYYKCLHKKNMSDLYVVKVNGQKLKNIYKCKIDSLTNELEEMDDEKYKNPTKIKNKKQEIINQLDKAKKEYAIINELDDGDITLSAILTAKYLNKIWTLFGGNSTILRELNSNYYIYYEIIKDALKEKFDIIDFFGTTGNPQKDNPVYGIHLFKKRLGGEYTEFIGEFDLIINKFIYYLYKTLVPIRYKYQKWKYKRENKNIQ